MLPPPQELVAAAVRAIRRMLRDHFTGTAAELAYYGLLSTVPCIAAFVGILGLLGSDPETTEAIARIVREGVSTEAGEAAREAARHVLDRDGAAGVALGVGVVTTLWGASIYLAAFRRAAYRVHGEDPGPAWRLRPLQMGLTFLGLVVLALTAIVLAVTERLHGRSRRPPVPRMRRSRSGRWPVGRSSFVWSCWPRRVSTSSPRGSDGPACGPSAWDRSPRYSSGCCLRWGLRSGS